MSGYDVVGIGIACADLLTVVPHLPQPDEVYRAVGRDLQGGGPVATALVALARLGATAAYLGEVAEDTWGDFLLAEFDGYGVSTAWARRCAGASSAVSVILIDQSSGARSIIHDPASLPEAGLDRDQEAAVRSARILHLDGEHLSTALAAARIARAAGVLVSLDAGAGELWPGREQLLPLVDVLIVARAFARQTTGLDDPLQAGPALLAGGAREVVITDGANGCWYWDASQHLRRPAYAVNVVDTTGAGDTFHGAYLYGLLQGWEPAARLAFASATAALKCTQVGGRRGISTRDQVLDFLRRHND